MVGLLGSLIHYQNTYILLYKTDNLSGASVHVSKYFNTCVLVRVNKYICAQKSSKSSCQHTYFYILPYSSTCLTKMSC